MKITKRKIAIETLERYTGSKFNYFQPYILLTNFPYYVNVFSKKFNSNIYTGTAMHSSHCLKEKISIVDFRIGSPTAALVIDLLSFINPKAVLMLGMCGGLRKEHKIGDFFNPVAAIRDEGTSDHYMPARVPALSSFIIQRFVCEELDKLNLKYHTGVTHTTNIRFWEFEKEFKKKLIEEKVQVIEMECATLFTAGFARYVPVGALLLISDLPMTLRGIKTKSSSEHIFNRFTDQHINIGIKVLMNIRDKQNNIKYQW
jgi:AMP nucleosidase